MSCEHEPNPRLGWLEIVQEEGNPAQRAFCPYRDRAIDAAVCYACKDCSGIALSPKSRRYYVVCERAAIEGVWVEGGTQASPALIHHCCTCGAEAEELPRRA